ncbi:hypothetical protein GIB67_040166 [Kingdonia uniflora]|uniref:AP2/ERF domain-containing protein n=1 Tax=Kingdonia uniflora TaxID=39325 RepID=A0A7J7MV26_9MAGN|nr:hypothetical protein GIB67_040166 [Kingdonia uniflora]
MLEWNPMSSHGDEGVPIVEDFLGIGNTENPPEISVFNQIQSNHPEDNFISNALQPYESPAPISIQSNDSHSLTLSVGNGRNLNAEGTGSSLVEVPARRCADTFGQRTSIYRGVTKHRWTGRYEAHLWDNSCRREGQSRKGRQGGYDKEDKAARAYDLAALKYWGTSTTTNFPITNYDKELEEMKHMTRQEFVASLRRKSSGFSRGASMYRGVTRHHQHGRWQARIGRVAGNKDLYLGTYTTEEEAAEAYDVAAIKFRGLSAVTNFDMNRYDVKGIMDGNSVPLGGGAAKRLKDSQAIEAVRKREEMAKALVGPTFYDGSSSSYQGYPFMSVPFEQPQPLLALQNSPSTHYTLDPQFHQNYSLNQQHSTYLFQAQNQDSQFHHTYLQNAPAFYPALMSPTSMMESGGSSINAYNEGFLSTGVPIAASSSVGSPTDHAGYNIKPDFDMTPSIGYGGWSADSVNGMSPGPFTMWSE